MEQRTNEWFIARLGKITASQVEVLMRDRKEAMTELELAAHKAANPKSRVTTKTVPFSEATLTYLDTKVMEHYMPITSKDQYSRNIVSEYVEERQLHTRATEYGALMEDSARERYIEQMGYEVFEVGFIPYDKYPLLAGASPDGLIRQERGCIEIKCPYTLEKHLQHLLYETPSDLLRGEPQYYWQAAMVMLVTETEFCDFISFCPYVSLSKQLKVLRIPRNDYDMHILHDRISLAVKYMRGKMTEIENATTIIK